MCDREVNSNNDEKATTTSQQEQNNKENENDTDTDTDNNEGDWKKQIYYPIDFQEAARIIKQHKPYGPKSWPATLVVTKTNSTTHNHKGDHDHGNGGDTHSDDIAIAVAIERVTKLIDPQSGANPRYVWNALPTTKVAMKKLLQAIPSNTFTDTSRGNGNGNDPVDDDEILYLNQKRSTKELVKEVARSVLEPRDIDWIQHNGVCLEHLIPKQSTIIDAGLGGFAQYGISKGDIVVPAPVLQTVHKEVLTLYERGVNVLEDPDKYKLGTGLLYNYCFGHVESSMLLCPLTSAMLLNHCSTRRGGVHCTNSNGDNGDGSGGGPNARVQWSTGWDTDSIPWRNATLHDIDHKFGRVLSLEVVATRDIIPGEEVFIDYGSDWETAWHEHVRNWDRSSIDSSSVQQSSASDFISAQEANNNKGPILSSLISNNLRENVNHPYLLVGCQYQIHKRKDFQNNNYTKSNDVWRTTFSDQEILETYSGDGSNYVYDDDTMKYLTHREYSHWPCSILKEEETTTTTTTTENTTDDSSMADRRYTVQIHQSPLRSGGRDTRTTAWAVNDVPRILTNYPQESIHYFIKPNAQDHMLPGVFRHHIGLPPITDDDDNDDDDTGTSIYPEHWLNLKKKK